MKFASFGHVTLIAAASLVVALSVQLNAERRSRVEATAQAVALVPGYYAPEVQLLTTHGDSVVLGRTAQNGQLYFVYNTTCMYCERSIKVWKELATSIPQSWAVQVLGVSLDSLSATEEYERRHALPYPSAVMSDLRLKDIHRFGVVPQMILLDPEGRVKFSRVGVLESGAAVDSVVAAVASLAEGITGSAVDEKAIAERTRVDVPSVNPH